MVKERERTMAIKRKTQVIPPRARVTKKLTLKIGQFQSYSFEFGLEDDVLDGESKSQAMLRLETDVDNKINEELKEVDGVASLVASRFKQNEEKRR
jgi:hypothetical protein